MFNYTLQIDWRDIKMSASIINFTPRRLGKSNYETLQALKALRDGKRVDYVDSTGRYRLFLNVDGSVQKVKYST